MTSALPIGGEPGPIRALWQRRQLIRELTVRELGERFSGALLGYAWLILQPLASLLVFTFVFAVCWGRELEFVGRLFCGLLVYLSFADVIGRAPRLVASRPNYVKKVVFPLEVLPLPALVAAQINFGVGVALLLGFQLAFLGGVPWTVIFLPLVLVPLLMLTLGLAWLIASLGVFVRDVQNVVRVLLQLLFFLSPIVWTLEMVPESVRPFAWLNPLLVQIESVRAVVTHGSAPDVVPFAGLSVFSAVVLWGGYAWFRRTRVGFADVL